MKNTISMLYELLKFCIWIIVTHSISAETNGLRLTNVSIPRHKDLHEPAVLSCNFELGQGKLYSVKWYKDEYEFFRYMPENSPPFQTFPREGVNLDLSQSNMTVITLKPLNFNTTGSYRCEVSTDAPNFETVVRNGNMTVMVFPKDNPTIDGIRRWYDVGEYVTGNCTSAHSNPAAELSWYINQEKASSWLLEKYPIVTTDDYLYSRALGLRFQVNRTHFLNDKMELRCVAKIDDYSEMERFVTVRPRERHSQGNEKPATGRFRNVGTRNKCRTPQILFLTCYLFYVKCIFVY